MGNGRWDSGSWATYRSVHVDPVPQAQRFSAGADPANDPAKFKVRESRISAANPRPTPIVLGLDCTGSMPSFARKPLCFCRHVYSKSIQRHLRIYRTKYLVIDDLRLRLAGPAARW